MNNEIPKLLRTKDVMELLAVKRDTLKKLVREGAVPPPLIIGASKRWELEPLLDHVRRNRPEK